MEILVFDAIAARVCMAYQQIPTIAELARRSEIGEPHLRQIFAGLIPTPEVRSRLAKFLKISDHALWVRVPREAIVKRGGDAA